MRRSDIEVKIRHPSTIELQLIGEIYKKSMTDLLKRHDTSEKVIQKAVMDIPQWELKLWHDLSNEKKAFLSIAEVEDTGDIVGFIYGHIKNGNVMLGWISAHFVLPEWQLKGIGTKLLQECKTFFLKKDVKKIAALTTHAINLVSQTVYRKYGNMQTQMNLINFDLECLTVPEKYKSINYENISVDEIISLDEEKTKYDRSRVLHELFKHENAIGIKIKNGYSVIVPEKHIGPLGAHSPQEMIQLIFMSKMIGGIVVRIPENYPPEISSVTAEVDKYGGKVIDALHLMSEGKYTFQKYYAPYGMHG